MSHLPLQAPWLLYGLLGCSLAMNLVMVLDRPSSDEASEEVAAEELALAEAGDVAIAPAVPVVEAPAAVAPPADDWQVASGDLSHSIARTFQTIVGDQGNALGAVYARLFVWDLDLRRDLQRGDRVEAVYHTNRTGDLEIVAARFVSIKLGRALNAYQWQAPGDAFPSYWNEEGVEVPYRLKGGPLQDYEQITSLLKDRPTHEGMDFKTPPGTPVTSPKSGVVTRVNWNWGANGNCLEVRFEDGVLAKFLHLSENQVDAGMRVEAGQVIALTGNTGHSTAPHLHYQLNRGEAVLDPLDYHGTERRKLSAEAMGAFSEETARLDAALGQAMASR